MKAQTITTLAVFLGAALVSAVPNYYPGEKYDECYKCEYYKDDCGKSYGG
jgi:hypothetical protein